MPLQGVRIGFAITGSHCTIADVLPIVARLVKDGAVVTPIFSESATHTDTRFGPASQWTEEMERITGQKTRSTIVDAEPIGPQKLLDIVVIAPCTGNTLAKLANGITDTSVLMAAKAQLRNLRPVLLAISTNDGLSNNLKNIGQLMNMKNVYMVPFGQDNAITKANSLIARMELIPDAITAALQQRQLQPVLLANLS
ncbi:dipicolinate synthase subunit B [Heliobacterium gestii]|uniref:Dipicolinate synthase subunit B n=1 Tax=Heliomicrobium gestii TaxID=2699 RepID=A0A845LHQ9_HELGE|nr:dipicolinate synthase subunit B [Heliomicrobium gestii]MBM7868396.1 dipicolinate synthase subunit B [Heliomicrobium gestii]MZP44550.1 dipicolinate synthase subunit B [Heliomicrobium gestii]